tara:strand:+ start:771 stop:1043 length:273 start_codon:yes stop_codon:yes gene_type:complete
METVSILWRPTNDWDGQDKRDENEEDFKEDIENLIIILNKKFKALKIKKNFDFQVQKQVGGGECDYNPYSGHMNRQMELMEVMKRADEKK